MRFVSLNNAKVDWVIAYKSKKGLSYKIFQFMLNIDLFTFCSKKRGWINLFIMYNQLKYN